ncbi:aldehyde dehydrogenase family protein [Streptomyces sp. B6B3]|uniref:aldehyde dehydrogenase family protein n=1 Tax=Streptomyces sp. B6B3 TaxID=3153570 RepID=UPI00325C84D4
MDPLDVAERFAPGAQYLAGQLRTGTSGRRHTVVDPATGEPVCGYELAGVEDVEDAVAAARRARPQWAAATPGERAAVLQRLAGLLAEQADDLAYTESLQTGKPLTFSQQFDVVDALDDVAFVAGSARHLPGAAAAEYDAVHTSYVRREPVGVVALLAPWNYPLRMAVRKALPAVATGNTVVLKPSELTPLTALMLAQAATAAGLPDGVLNVVSGTGGQAGEHLVGHPDVAMVSYTGSADAGRRVARIATGGSGVGVKRLDLELGGKAPFLVFDDADLEAAVHGAVAAALVNAGQDRAAATRAYVQRPLFDAFVAGVADLMDSVRLGDPFEAGTDLGPLISVAHRERVAGCVDRMRGGATVVTGGEAPDFASTGALAKGAYYRPTLLTGVARGVETLCAELLGPVLAALPFDADEEGLALANAAPPGPAASVWSRDVYRTGRATRELMAGRVWVNDHLPTVSEMPHGVRRDPGPGGDAASSAFERYTRLKHVMYDTTAAARKGWHRTVFGADRFVRSGSS